GSEPQEEDAGTVEQEPKRTHRFPASMGLSVFLPPGSGDFIEVEVRYADYHKENIAEDKEAHARPGWKRVAHRPPVVKVPLDAKVLGSKEGVSIPDTVGLRLRGELRETEMDGLAKGTRVLSLFLVNERT